MQDDEPIVVTSQQSLPIRSSGDLAGGDTIVSSKSKTSLDNGALEASASVPSEVSAASSERKLIVSELIKVCLPHFQAKS